MIVLISFFKFNNSLIRHNIYKIYILLIYSYIYVNNRYSCLNIEINTIWNICDSGNTTQGVMSDILGKLFNIETGFYGVLISNFARLNLSSIVDEANDKHMKPWNMCVVQHRPMNNVLWKGAGVNSQSYTRTVK